MNDSSEEQLRRIENELEDLSERQRISRFDTLMFLMYPLTLFIMSLLVNVLLQWKSLSQGGILGVMYSDILLVFFVFMGMGMVYTLLRFIRAYTRDNLEERFVAFRSFMSYGVSGFSSAIIYLFWLSTTLDLVQIYPSLDLAGVTIRLGFVFGSMVAILFLIGAIILKYVARVLPWLKAIAPRKAAAEKIDSIDLLKETNSLLRLGTIAWIITCVSYGLVVVNAVHVAGVKGTVLYHILLLSALVVMTLTLVAKRISRICIIRKPSKSLKSAATTYKCCGKGEESRLMQGTGYELMIESNLIPRSRFLHLFKPKDIVQGEKYELKLRLTNVSDLDFGVTFGTQVKLPSGVLTSAGNQATIAPVLRPDESQEVAITILRPQAPGQGWIDVTITETLDTPIMKQGVWTWEVGKKPVKCFQKQNDGKASLPGENHWQYPFYVYSRHEMTQRYHTKAILVFALISALYACLSIFRLMWPVFQN
jgi:hypothetical protein